MASNCFGTIHNYQLANPAIVPQIKILGNASCPELWI